MQIFCTSISAPRPNRRVNPLFSIGYGGDGGIRTHERVAPLHTFQACAFDHSATSPHALSGRAARIDAPCLFRKRDCGGTQISMKNTVVKAAALLTLTAPVAAQEAPEGAPSPNAIVDAALQGDWVTIPAEDLLVMELAPDAAGNPRTVVIQLIPEPFSQGWVENIRTLARAEWYDGITINRVQDNYVVQWGDPNHDNPEATGEAKPLPKGLNVMVEDSYLTEPDLVLKRELARSFESLYSLAIGGAEALKSFSDSGDEAVS